MAPRRGWALWLRLLRGRRGAGATESREIATQRAVYLRRASVVIVQQSAQSFASSDGPVVVLRRWRRSEQSVVETLMVALKVIVLDECSDGAPQVPLAEQYELVQALALDRQHEPLGVGVQVRAVRRQPDALDTCGAEHVAKLVGEERIAVVDCVAH